MSAMGSDSDIVATALFELARCVVEVKRHISTRDEASAKGDVALAVQMQRQSALLVDAIVTITAAIKGRVIGADGIEGKEHSLGELVIRAKRMVIIAQMGVLQEVIQGAATSGDAYRDASWMFVGRFCDFKELASHVFGELREFVSLWMRFREGVYENRALYSAAIRVSLRAVGDLLKDPDLAYFVKAGARRTLWPAVQRPCIRIHEVVTIDIDADPDDRLFSYYQRPIANQERER